MAKILIIGCGSIGEGLAEKLVGAGHSVVGVRRNPPEINPEKGNPHFTYHRADITVPASLIKLDSDFDIVYFVVSANSRDANSYHDIYETGLHNVLDWHHKASLKAPLIFVSSTSVYGQNQGEWVDEGSTTAPDKATSRLIVKAENRLWNHDPAHLVVRFSGIYGPGREYLIRMAAQNPVIQSHPPYYTNRIHQADCIGMLAFLLEKHLAGNKLEPCYLASDDDPAPLWEVISWMAGQMQCKQPDEKSVGEGADQNKRCRNDKLKALGYRFIYPDYKAGYKAIIASRLANQNG